MGSTGGFQVRSAQREGCFCEWGSAGTQPGPMLHTRPSYSPCQAPGERRDRPQSPQRHSVSSAGQGLPAL